MKKTALILFFLLCYKAVPQSLTAFDPVISAYPIISASFYARDAGNKLIYSLDTSNMQVTEFDKKQKVLSVTCPSQIYMPLSFTLVIDVSISMGQDNKLANAKTAALAMMDELDASGTEYEIALVSFSTDNHLVQPFTKDKNLMRTKIKSLAVNGITTDFSNALINNDSSGIPTARKGIYKRVLVFLTDGEASYDYSETTIIGSAVSNKITIFCVMMGGESPAKLVQIAKQTGGKYFYGIYTEHQAKQTYLDILNLSLVEKPCTITWLSEVKCSSSVVTAGIICLENNSKGFVAYTPPFEKLPGLKIEPASMMIIKPPVAIQKDTTITVSAVNSAYEVYEVKSSNPAFTISPDKFSLARGESKALKVSFTPVNAGFTHTDFYFSTDVCDKEYTVSGGYPGKKSSERVLKLIHPNGGNTFVVGSDTVITWDGVNSDEKVNIEYTTNNGSKWIRIADSVQGLSYNWRVPKTPSYNCLAKVSARQESYECLADLVTIGNQTWMAANLDVATYRNGDTIPQVTDPTEWDHLTTGAWCYYDNDPVNGLIYGKLYNWYAVNDPRGLAPDGFHIPTPNEWSLMIAFLGGQEAACGKIKCTGTVADDDGFWTFDDSAATNETCFSGLPAGSRGYLGAFGSKGRSINWWSSAMWSVQISNAALVYSVVPSRERFGYSVRCIKN